MDKVIMDISNSDLTLSEVLRMVERFQSENPEMEVYLDGDRRAIMGRPRQIDSMEV
jgi:hypothetical protein